MDTADIKDLLQVCRVGGQDREGPIFRTALEDVARDPQLAEWFRQEQEFDAVMLRRFAEVSVDTELRDRMLREMVRGCASFLGVAPMRSAVRHVIPGEEKHSPT